MKYLLFITLLFSFTQSLATLNEVDKAQIFNRNILKDGGFENGKYYWTSSGGSFAVVTSGSNLLTGLTSVTWDSSAADQTLTSSTVSIPNGMYGRNGVASCLIMVPSGTATHLLEVHDGSNVLAYTTIVSNTTPVRTDINFVFPLNGNIKLRLKSVSASEPLITIDSCFQGPAEGYNLGLSIPQDIFSAKVSSSGTVSDENINFINSNCTNPTTGDYTCTFTSNFFTAVPNCQVTQVSGDGTGANHCYVDTGVPATASTVSVHCEQDAGADTDRAFNLSCQKTGADAPQIINTAETLANSWSGYHGSGCIWTRTNTAFGDFTDDASGCTLTERSNTNFGTVTTSGTVSPTTTFTPKVSKYYVCAVTTTQNSAGDKTSLALLEGSNIIAERDVAGTSSTFLSHTLCGMFTATPGTAKTLKIQGKAASGAISLGATNATTSIEWNIIAINQSLPARLVSNGVVSPSSGVIKIANAEITSVTTTAIVRQTGSWIASVTDNGAGDTTVNFTAGIFSEVPYCKCTATSTTTHYCNIDSTTSATSSLVRIQTYTDSGSASDAIFNLECAGAP